MLDDQNVDLAVDSAAAEVATKSENQWPRYKGRAGTVSADVVNRAARELVDFGATAAIGSLTFMLAIDPRARESHLRLLHILTSILNHKKGVWSFRLVDLAKEAGLLKSEHKEPTKSIRNRIGDLVAWGYLVRTAVKNGKTTYSLKPAGQENWKVLQERLRRHTGRMVLKAEIQDHVNNPIRVVSQQPDNPNRVENRGNNPTRAVGREYTVLKRLLKSITTDGAREKPPARVVADSALPFKGKMEKAGAQPKDPECYRGPDGVPVVAGKLRNKLMKGWRNEEAFDTSLAEMACWIARVPPAEFKAQVVSRLAADRKSHNNPDNMSPAEIADAGLLGRLRRNRAHHTNGNPNIPGQGDNIDFMRRLAAI